MLKGKKNKTKQKGLKREKTSEPASDMVDTLELSDQDFNTYN